MLLPVAELVSAHTPHTCKAAAKSIGLRLLWRSTGPDEEAYDGANGNLVIRINPEFYRPAEVDLLQADPTRAREDLKWTPKVTFEELASRMMLSDLKGKCPK